MHRSQDHNPRQSYESHRSPCFAVTHRRATVAPGASVALSVGAVHRHVSFGPHPVRSDGVGEGAIVTMVSSVITGFASADHHARVTLCDMPLLAFAESASD